MTNYHMRYGVGQQGALPRGARQYLCHTPDAIKVYLYILENQPVCRFVDTGLNVAAVHGILARLKNYTLIQNHIRSKKGNLYEWTVNPFYKETMLNIIGGLSE